MGDDWQAVIGLAAGALGGAAVGVEREWSGHAVGRHARFAGVRTFTLLGGLGGAVGWIATIHHEPLAAVLLGGAAVLVVAAYVAASRHEVDGTTEVAALVVLGAGTMAGIGHLAVASGVIAVTTLLLVEKSRLHALVQRLDDEELRAAARFAVMAVVVLPLLPPGPYGPFGGVRPRELWALVLLFSGLGFAGYVARRAVGAHAGYPLAGLLGGLVSSTAVTFTFARSSRTERALEIPLAAGVVAASTVMLPRVLLATAVLAPELVPALVLYLVVPFVTGIVASAVALRAARAAPGSAEEPRNPLQLWPAIQMAFVFQLVLFGVHVVRHTWGDLGLLVSGAVIGLADVDALTLSMAKIVGTGTPTATAALALTIGVLANTVLKLAIAVALGGGVFRRWAGGGLVAIGAAAALSLVLLGLRSPTG